MTRRSFGHFDQLAASFANLLTMTALAREGKDEADIFYKTLEPALTECLGHRMRGPPLYEI